MSKIAIIIIGLFSTSVVVAAVGDNIDIRFAGLGLLFMVFGVVGLVIGIIVLFLQSKNLKIV